MDELQLLQMCNQWDDVNLSTPELRRQRLEMLLCQKVNNGEDVSQWEEFSTQESEVRINKEKNLICYFFINLFLDSLIILTPEF